MQIVGAGGMAPALETGPQQGRSVPSVTPESLGIYDPCSSILGQDAGHRAEFVQREATLSLEGPGASCHLAGAVLDGASRVTSLSVPFLPPSTEAAKAWGQDFRGIANRLSRILRPKPEMVQDSRTLYSTSLWHSKQWDISAL